MTQSGQRWGQRWDTGQTRASGCRTYTIQVRLDMAVGIDGGLLAAQLVDATNNGDIAADVAVEEGRGHTRGGLRFHRCQELDQARTGQITLGCAEGGEKV